MSDKTTKGTHTELRTWGYFFLSLIPFVNFAIAYKLAKLLAEREEGLI